MSKPICFNCKEPITTNNYLRTGDLTFHNEHFKCVICNTSLHHKRFFNKDNKFYCQKDYENAFCQTCSSCDKKIVGKAIAIAFGKYFHPEHFVCATCGIQLTGKYLTRNGKPYCENHRGPCSLCKKNVNKNEAVAIASKIYHKNCLNCKDCGESLCSKSKQVFFKEENIYCKQDFLNRFAQVCAKCGKYIERTCVSAKNKKEYFHEDCFTCVECNIKLDKYRAKDGDLLCATHYKQRGDKEKANKEKLINSGDDSKIGISGTIPEDQIPNRLTLTLSTTSSNTSSTSPPPKSSPTSSNSYSNQVSPSLTSSIRKLDIQHSRTLSAPGVTYGRGGTEIKWRKGDLIGKGSFGVVYMGMNTQTGELIAIKEVTLQTEEDYQQAASLEMEIKLMERLRHKNIVAFLGAERTNDKFHILMEYVAGKSIDNLLSTFGEFDENTIKIYTKQMLSSIKYLHDNNVIHRDIKGKNILVDTSGNLKLCDFGSAKQLQDILIKNAPSIGYNYTPLWTAPEVLLGNYGRKVDLWSLGCVIIEMATAKPPWSEHNFDNPFRALYHIGNTNSIPAIPNTLSATGKDFLLKMLTRDPEKRSDASDLLKHEWLQDLVDTDIDCDVQVSDGASVREVKTDDDRQFRHSKTRSTSKSSGDDSTMTSADIQTSDPGFELVNPDDWTNEDVDPSTTINQGVPDSWDDEDQPDTSTKNNVPDSWDDEEEKPSVKSPTIQNKNKTETVSPPQKKSEKNKSVSSSDNQISSIDKQHKTKSKENIQPKSKESRKKKVIGELRSPICCILGHVDTGKTKLLDKIRSTNVQDKEAGGITQQIGASYFPMDNIIERIRQVKKAANMECKLPGLLIIDTPGHESFANLRTRGSHMCDIAILVVDIMHGLEPQTLESLNLLRKRNTPFVVALNKIDRNFDWQAQPWSGFEESYELQGENVHNEFEKHITDTKLAFAEQGLNCELYYKNPDVRKVISLVPTSAITGEGIPDLLMLLVEITQKRMASQLQYLSELQCTILEVKVTEGHGVTIDVILANGVLRDSDTLVICGLNGPIVTNVRALLTPEPLRELRVKSEYRKHKEVKAAMGIKISAPGLDHAIAGSQVYVCSDGDDLDDLKDEVMADFAEMMSKIDKSGRGVCVQASTLGSLEALLSFLKDMKVPVSGIAIGAVHKKDVVKASVMLEHKPEYAVILAFDVKIDKEARELADESGVRIFSAEIIYHLFQSFTKYIEQIKAARRAEASNVAVFPCVLKILPDCIFRVKDPIVVGVKVVDGLVKIGTPICVPGKDKIRLGKISGIQKNHVDFNEARKDEEICIKIQPSRLQSHIMYGRQFDYNDQLVSLLSRKSIDLLKENFKDELTNHEWNLVKKLKSVFEIY